MRLVSGDTKTNFAKFTLFQGNAKKLAAYEQLIQFAVFEVFK